MVAPSRRPLPGRSVETHRLVAPVSGPAAGDIAYLVQPSHPVLIGRSKSCLQLLNDRTARSGRPEMSLISASFARVLALALVREAGAALAQESSVVTLEAPTGESSGEVMPEGAAAPASPCGTQPITMARMQWPTSALLT